jgi:hypothetical protein
MRKAPFMQKVSMFSFFFDVRGGLSMAIGMYFPTGSAEHPGGAYLAGFA